jgi:phage terminase small subunit
VQWYPGTRKWYPKSILWTGVARLRGIASPRLKKKSRLKPGWKQKNEHKKSWSIQENEEIAAYCQASLWWSWKRSWVSKNPASVSKNQRGFWILDIKIPKSLKKCGRDFFKKVLTEFDDLQDIHDLERLKMAGKCLDDIAEAEKQIKKDGRYVFDRYNQTKEHCAQKTIRENRIIFCRIIRELGLDLEVPEPRPPRQY